jgi:death-on-curing protein
MPVIHYLDRRSVNDLWSVLMHDSDEDTRPALLRDETLLESALALPRQRYYPTVVDKAAVLMRSIVKNHPFVDGNKRMGFSLALVFLWFNGYVITATDDEVVEFVMRLAGSVPALDWEDVAQWLRQYVIAHDEAEARVGEAAREAARIWRVNQQLDEL